MRLSQILGGRVYRGCENFGGEGTPFLVFYCIFINKFCKKFGGRVHFYPPSPSPLCASTELLLTSRLYFTNPCCKKMKYSDILFNQV
jgi:hypothetical protein